MKKLCILVGMIGCMSQAYALEQQKVVTVNQDVITLSMEDFQPITTNWANREVTTGYQALIDVVGAESSLVFQGKGELTARWFASNFGMTAKVSCSGIPIGMDKVYGYRINRVSTPASPEISELRHNVGACTQLKVEFNKEGSISRQFYTRIQDINFSLSVKGLNNTSEGV
ncbi:hypothetical protein J8L98_19910 [Pseudoalteromonas sp. MMG013]|uniref:hypothetical protein n=1 Tax=Pseudoalteromonas sp. MMG013 TaxID=2822687 RepID=UPI001B392FA9|nr:hypothetical protein [Pseudoalteromonas sp. MMG013]MBQ4863957.1 hypothetical protein [Pseudoalteromonas sp. MMG013]